MKQKVIFISHTHTHIYIYIYIYLIKYNNLTYEVHSNKSNGTNNYFNWTIFKIINYV